MNTSRLARSFALASFLGSALVSGATLDAVLPQEAQADSDIDESYFYTSLSSQGSWVQNVQFGWVWYPSQRSNTWRPYTIGHWVWTDYGEWMWVSDEPFGWATYHYGRWFLDSFYGWVWLPGRVWAPAWVSWRDCNDYVGWSPLGPWGYYDYGHHRYRDWDHYGGYHDHDDNDWHHDGGGSHHHGDNDGGWNHHGEHVGGGSHGRGDHDQWNFTRKRDFTNGRVDRVMVSSHQAENVFRRSRPLPAPSAQDEREGRGIGRGIDHRAIEKASGRPVRAVKVEDTDSPQAHGRQGGKPDHVQVFRPKVSERKPDSPTPDRLPNNPRTDRSQDAGRDERGGHGADTRGSSENRGGVDQHGGHDDHGSQAQPPQGGRRANDSKRTLWPHPEPGASGNEDHGATDNGGMNRGATDHGSIERGSMEHGSTEHGSMEHGAADHGSRPPHQPQAAPRGQDQSGSGSSPGGYERHDRGSLSGGNSVGNPERQFREPSHGGGSREPQPQRSVPVYEPRSAPTYEPRAAPMHESNRAPAYEPQRAAPAYQPQRAAPAYRPPQHAAPVYEAPQPSHSAGNAGGGGGRPAPPSGGGGDSRQHGGHGAGGAPPPAAGDAGAHFR